MALGGVAGSTGAGRARAVAGGVPQVRVMLCDDSATMRAGLARVLEADPAITVVAKVGDGRQALDALAGAQPDVVLLDLEMPVMDGMTALPLLLRHTPPPVVIVASALTQPGAAAAMAALRAGAADYVPKPEAGRGGAADPQFRAELIEKVKGWARIRRRPAMSPPPARPAAAPMPALAPAGPVARGTLSSLPTTSLPTTSPPTTSLPPLAPPPFPAATAAPRAAPSLVPPAAPVLAMGRGRLPRLLAIGSSTGGPQALAALVRRMTPPAVPVVVVQHMPAGFTAMLADHLNRLGVLPCTEAQDGEILVPGRLYVAPGDRHLLVEPVPASGAGGAPGGAQVRVRLSDAPPENFCRPAVDPMLRSAVACYGGQVLAVILTGMGQDGLLGCRAVVEAGGQVLAQDEASSVVWGMPGAVARAGLSAALLSPEGLAERAGLLLAGRAA